MGGLRDCLLLPNGSFTGTERCSKDASGELQDNGVDSRMKMMLRVGVQWVDGGTRAENL